MIIFYTFKEWSSCFIRKKQPALFIKLDVSKAFDSIGWQYLLEVLTALRFSTKWCNRIPSILIIFENFYKWKADPKYQTCLGAKTGGSVVTNVVYHCNWSAAEDDWSSSSSRLFATCASKESKVTLLHLCWWCGSICTPLTSWNSKAPKKICWCLVSVQDWRWTWARLKSSQYRCKLAWSIILRTIFWAR